MQGGVREETVKFTEVQRTPCGLIIMETLELGIDSVVSLTWYNINVVTNYTSALLQGM